MDVRNIKTRKKLVTGYGRVSTRDQNLDLQIHALEQYGCDEVYCDTGVSGGTHPSERKQFVAAQALLREGDIFVVWKLDRLGRTLKGVIETVDALKADGVEFISLTENIDTTTATGRAFWQFIGLMAELERGLIQERTIEGMAAAKRRGVRIGRPRKLSNDVVHHLRDQIQCRQININAAARQYNVSPSTIRRALTDN